MRRTGHCFIKKLSKVKRILGMMNNIITHDCYFYDFLPKLFPYLEFAMETSYDRKFPVIHVIREPYTSFNKIKSDIVFFIVVFF